MPKSLVIVESPAKAKTINKFLGSDFEVTASMGHVRDLPDRELGVDIENNFAPTYVVSPDKKKTIKQLEKLAEKCKDVYLAPDPDREGEAISWHLAELLKPVLNGKEIHRVTFNEITKSAVRHAIQHPSQINMDLVNAQQARRILDRLVGYKISPMLTRMLTRHRSALSAGRVQSVTLRLVCEREEAIRAFVTVEYWTINGVFKNGGGQELQAELFSVEGKKISHKGEGKDEEEKDDANLLHIQSQEQANELIARLQEPNYSIQSVESRKRTRRPPAPYITSTLQQDASRLFGFTGDKTMRAAQSLYEGIDIGDETVGLITYMRTDSVRIANEAIEKGREYIFSKFGERYLPATPNVYKSKKSAQDAHEAIRPTHLDESHSPEKVKKYLNADQAKIYDMIWKRFLACQMTPAEYLSTKIDIAGNGYLFRATGSVLTFDGYTVVYRDPENEKDQQLPQMKEGESLDLKQIDSEQHFTRPPARYNDASLIKELESEGIGRPSTYSSIIKTIVDRKYIERKEKRFYTTDLGEVVNKLLVTNFPDIIEVGFTAGVENKLDEVEDGKANWVEILRNFYEPFAADLSKAPKGFGEVLRSLQQPTDQICEKCGKPLVKKWGRTSWFLACSGYPDCDFSASLNEVEIVETEEVCDKCGAKMVIRPGRFGNFLACSAYPKCKNARPLPTGIICPLPNCGGDIVQRRSRRGTVFYGCSHYPNCEFVSWDPPITESCPECKNPFLVFKDYKRKGPTVKCPNKECKYSRPARPEECPSKPEEAPAGEVKEKQATNG
ncbi:MAG: type I DNA topoisomerase [Candidatus Omnitrophota bacterium]|nr:MAG: type I DNA topoisomerase [Candidatus Omnitrophota bacterium]